MAVRGRVSEIYERIPFYHVSRSSIYLQAAVHLACRQRKYSWIDISTHNVCHIFFYCNFNCLQINEKKYSNPI